MAGNRKAAEQVCLQWIEELMPGSENASLYRDLFKTMSDKDFDTFIERLEKGDIELSIQAPNLGKFQLDLKRNLKIAEKLGHKFFERIWIDEGNDIPPYLTNPEYLIVDLPLRRQAQLLPKKISIPKNNNTIDNLTGQPTGDSKGSKISYPELQILAAMGLDESLVELLKYRGGDVRGFNAMNATISRTGGVDTRALDKLGTKVKSTSTMRSYLLAQHYDTTL